REIPAFADSRVAKAAPDDVVRDECAAVRGGQEAAPVAHDVGGLRSTCLAAPVDEQPGVPRGRTADRELRERDPCPAHHLDAVLVTVALVAGARDGSAADRQVMGTGGYVDAVEPVRRDVERSDRSRASV